MHVPLPADMKELLLDHSQKTEENLSQLRVMLMRLTLCIGNKYNA